MSEMWKRWEGQVVNGTFHLRQYLGGSKHSAVFLTEHAERKSEKAAIKLIPTDSAGEDLQLSWWRMAGKVAHPHLIRLYQMGRFQLGDLPLLFLVMEYAEENLSQIVPQRSLTASEARAMLAPTLDALAYLHREGFAHGHLKPANIMAVGDQVKLSSDGLWWMGEPSVEIGNSGAYDPPEKATSGISPMGDVWSLGMTLVESLTMRVPVWQGMGQSEPVLPQNLPSPFLDMARHCLRRDPQQRWTVAEITEQLHGSERERPETVKRKAVDTFAQRRILVPVAVAGLAILLILAGSRLLRPGSGHPPNSRPIPKQLQATEAKPEKPKAGQPAELRSDKQTAPKSLPNSASDDSESTSDVTSKRASSREILHQDVPRVPQSARDTIQGTVRVNVRVHVDPSGNVTREEFDSTGPSKYFARLAKQAAEHWKFAPAQARQPSREWILRFEFHKNGTRVHPVRVAP